MKKILVTRHFGVSGNELTKEKFVEILKEDLYAAKNRFREIEEPRLRARYEQIWQEHYDAAVRKYTMEAMKYLKTEKGRQKRVEREMKAYVKRNPKNNFSFRDLAFFDFQTNPDVNYIDYSCIIGLDENISEVKLGKCYDVVTKSKYFQSSIGWRLVGDYYGRPQIEMILPKDMENEYLKAERNLENAITEFYQNTTYYGD